MQHVQIYVCILYTWTGGVIMMTEYRLIELLIMILITASCFTVARAGPCKRGQLINRRESASTTSNQLARACPRRSHSDRALPTIERDAPSRSDLHFGPKREPHLDASSAAVIRRELARAHASSAKSFRYRSPFDACTSLVASPTARPCLHMRALHGRRLTHRHA